MYTRRSMSEKSWDVVNISMLLLLGLVTLVPFLYILSTSVTPPTEVLRHGMTLIPIRGFSLESYQYIFHSGSGIPGAYTVTILITAAGTMISLITTSAFSYSISKRYLPGRNIVTFLVLITMLFSGGLIPTYMVVKFTGLIDSLWSLIIPSMINSWYVILLASFFESIPASIEESARMDGCNDIAIFLKIIIPLSLPAMFTIGLFYAVIYWNLWFPAIIYINDKSKWPLQVLLRQIILKMDYSDIEVIGYVQPPSTSVRSAVIITVMLPIICVYPFIQKHFVKGIMIGAIKG